MSGLGLRAPETYCAPDTFLSPFGTSGQHLEGLGLTGLGLLQTLGGSWVVISGGQRARD